MTTARVAKRWVRNAADERAVANGCRFDAAKGEHVLEFARRYLRLYEGEHAGKALEPMAWQVDATMRLFGWQRWSERWGRWVRRFRSASIWVPKKNGKSPTLAWWGLYLLCADGEMGQKVYFGAKDGAQAREIAGKHAMEMCLASDELSEECTVNRTTFQITHEKTRSILKPISSGDSRAAKAKEGLNGSVLIDETHVVDREFMSRVSRAGISRSEPLLIEVSTAGDDPEGYGRERYDYGKAVERGDEDNDSHLFIAHEAPQDLTDADLAAEPEKYARRANPALGHTVDITELLADYQQSRRSVAALGDFKKYRLNIWQASSTPWLDMGAWASCRRPYALDSLDGAPCYAGLDLAKTRDTTALALLFPETQADGRTCYRQWVHYWLPEETARRHAKEVRYQDWAGAGWLTLTPGDTVDYQFVRKQVLAAFSRHRVLRLAFDTTYAQQMVQRLIEEDGLDPNCFLEFRQTLMTFANPTAAYERGVIDGTLWHPGNPLFTWQAGNVRVKTDVNGNMRPVKEKHGDTRTIDGVVAAIMAYALAMTEAGPSVYETRGALTLADEAPARPRAQVVGAMPDDRGSSWAALWKDEPEDD